MKKVLIVFIFILIIVASILSIKSCDIRSKNTETTTDFNEELSIDARTAFINANIRFSCLLIANPDLVKDKTASETLLNESYEAFDLPVKNDKLMISILSKYKNDPEIIAEVQKELKNCNK